MPDIDIGKILVDADFQGELQNMLSNLADKPTPEKMWEKIKEILELEPFITAESLYNHVYWCVTKDFVSRVSEIAEIVNERADDWINKIGHELAIDEDEVSKFGEK